MIGAAGPLGSPALGAEAADLYQVGSDLSVSAQTTYATAAPYDSVIVSGTFTVPGLFDTLTGSINWGDGSPPTAITLPPGSYAFSVPHDYTSTASSRYAIGVTLSDFFGQTAFAQTVVNIADPAPAFAAPGLVLSATSIDAYSTLGVSGTIVSPGGIHTNTVSINWGDGSAATTLVLGPGVYAFSTSHEYTSPPPGMVSGSDTIQATVTNEEQKTGSASAIVVVTDVPPTFTAGDLTLSPSSGNVGQPITLTGQFTAPGPRDEYTVTINWGDGSQSNRAVRTARPDRGLHNDSGPVHLFGHSHIFGYAARRAERGRLRDSGDGRRLGKVDLGRHVHLDHERLRRCRSRAPAIPVPA